MGSTLEKLQSDAKQLNKEDKFKLAHFLWQDLHEISPEAKAYWQKEMAERYKRIENGEAQLISLEDFRVKYAHLEKDLS